MRWGIVAALLGMSIATGDVGVAATQQDYQACNQATNFDLSITTCTRIVADKVEAAPDRARALLSRGNAYMGKDELARAILDYGEAAKLDPRNIFAYSSRAIAYARKGDATHAISDYGLAVMLDAKAVDDLTADNAELKSIAAAAQSSKIVTAHVADAAENFGGPPYCRYRVAMQNLVLKTQIGDKGAVRGAVLTGTMVETTVGGCSFRPLGTLPHTYSGNGSTNNGTIVLHLDAAVANSPRADAVFKGKVVGDRLTGTLTIHRNDAPGNLNWKVTSSAQ